MDRRLGVNGDTGKTVTFTYELIEGFFADGDKTKHNERKIEQKVWRLVNGLLDDVEHSNGILWVQQCITECILTGALLQRSPSSHHIQCRIQSQEGES